MQILLHIFAFLFAVFLLVTLHEFGHFWMARRLGIKTLRFSIGFGKALWRWYGKDGTEYIIAILPLGGYVKLLDEREMQVPVDELPFSFTRKSIGVRFLVVIAGPIMNWLLAIFLFALIFMIGVEQVKPVIGKVIPDSVAAQAGLKANQQIIAVDKKTAESWQKVMIALIYHMGEKGTLQVETAAAGKAQPQIHLLNLDAWKLDGLNPDPLKSLGIIPYQPPMPPVIIQVMKNQPADKAGLQAGDRIVSAAGKPVNDWMEVIQYIQDHPNENIALTIERKNQLINTTVQTTAKQMTPSKKVGFIGVAASPPQWPKELQYERRYSVLTAWLPAVKETLLFTVFNFVVFGKMIVGHISLQGLGGPITIFTSASVAFKQGVVSYLSFLAILSTMLACINVVPIPGLDGGHLLYLGLETILRRPVSLTAQILMWRIGIILLIVVMVQATVNDLMRLF